MMRRVWLLTATLVVALFTTHNSGAETAEEVVQKIRRGLEAGGNIELWEGKINFLDRDFPKAPKTFIYIMLLPTPIGDHYRADFTSPERVDGNTDDSKAYVGLRYLTNPTEGQIQHSGIAFRPDISATRTWTPPAMEEIRPGVPIPNCWVTFPTHLIRSYKKWVLDGNVLVSSEEGNPRSLPRIRIEFFVKEGMYLISKLRFEGQGRWYELAYEGYERVRDEFRPKKIAALGRSGKVEVDIETINFADTEQFRNSVFGMASFSQSMLSSTRLGSGDGNETVRAVSSPERAAVGSVERR